MEALQEIWHLVLVTWPSGKTLTVGQLAGVFLLLVLGYLASRFMGFLLGRSLAKTKLRPDSIYTLKRVTFITILVLVIFTALSLLGIPLTAFAFATGAIAIGVGFGAQNILNNFISGWILIAERPIRIGDFIEIDSAHGIVEQIGTRSTRIRRVDGVHLLVPNSQLLERTVINWTLVDKMIRTKVTVGVAYGSPIRKVASLFAQAVGDQKAVKTDPAPSVILEDYGDNAIIFEAHFWCEVAGERELRGIRSDIRFRLGELFDENGIVIAFPQRDVHLDSAQPLQIEVISPAADSDRDASR